MDAMKAAAERAKSGRGQIVAAMAEAGVGKSRLMFEFKATSAAGWTVLEVFSVSHGKASAFLPVIDLLWSYFKISSVDDERTRREKINGKIVTLDRSLEDALPYLYALIGLSEESSPIAGMEAQLRKRRSLEAIKRIVLRESLNQPLMVIFEDLHWIDEGTQELLNLLADSIATARILLLVNYRPEYSHQWGSKTYYTQLRLDPLGKESADEMLSALLGNDKDLAPLKRLIIEKTEGNPFFMEETYEMLLDEGAIVRNGTTKLVKPLGQLRIPPRVQDILAARIDRLAPDRKDLLQTLSVIGTEFKLGLVLKVAARPGAELEPMLSELQLGEFIYEQPASGDIEYTFKHALTREVAYNSVLSERRRILHERIGAALESVHADSLDDHIAELAHHYARSGNAIKALQYCLRAIQQFTDRGSSAEAVTQFEIGLEILQKLPDDDRRAELELDLRNAVSDALMLIKGYNSLEAEQASTRALELSRRPGIDWVKSWFALWGVLIVHLTHLDFRKMIEVGAELVARAEEHGDTALLAEAESRLALGRMFSGDFEPAAQGFERAWALLETIAKPSSSLKQSSGGERNFSEPVTRLATGMLNRVWSGENLWYLGYPDRGLERVSIATAMATESGFKNRLAEVHFYAARLHEVRRELEPMRERAAASLALSNEMGNRFFRDVSDRTLGAADAMAGDLEGGIARMREGLPMEVASALGRLGRFDEGLRMLDEGFSFIARTGFRINESEMHRVKGELLLLQDVSNAAPAEQSFRTAIEISRKQHAKSWELRATTSLARLLDKQGKRDEARTMLAAIYNWFTEGFDNADLKDAKALLNELSA